MDFVSIVFSVMLLVLCIFSSLSFLIYWKLGIGKILSFLLALPTAFLLLDLSIKTFSECYESFAIKDSLKVSLSPKDFSNIKKNRFICPSEYSYTRSGKKEWANFFGDEIIFQNEVERASGG